MIMRITPRTFGPGLGHGDSLLELEATGRGRSHCGGAGNADAWSDRLRLVWTASWNALPEPMNECRVGRCDVGQVAEFHDADHAYNKADGCGFGKAAWVPFLHRAELWQSLRAPSPTEACSMRGARLDWSGGLTNLRKYEGPSRNRVVLDRAPLRLALRFLR
jgi:hypothetical protein